MLRSGSLPVSLMRVLDSFRPCFTAPTFVRFVTLVTGLIARPMGRSVCGMLTGAGLAGVWHHSRAHRFFATATWSADQIGLVALRLIIGWLVPAGAPITVAVDDTMFRRSGRRVHAACWGYDGSLVVPKGGKKLSRGNTFVVAAVVVELPFSDRPIALPVLARPWRKGGPTKPQLGRELITLVAGRAGRPVHVVADTSYVCSELRDLPRGVTLTGPIPRHAALWEIHPEHDATQPRRGRGRPRVRGERIGTPAQLVAATAGRTIIVTRYGRTDTITVHERRCLWPGVFRSYPIRVIVIADPGSQLALVTTDMATPAEQIITRYASRWAIEVAFHDAKNHTGAGEARNRTQRAVERTVPFALTIHTVVIIWYHLAGHNPGIVRDRRHRAPWYTTKTHPAYLDMIVKLRRVLIAAQYHPGALQQPTPEQIRDIQLAWAQASA